MSEAAHGEWFYPDPTLVSFIKKMANVNEATEFAKSAPVNRPAKNINISISEFWPCGHRREGYQSACTRCLLRARQ